jgi:hypothetical protein
MKPLARIAPKNVVVSQRACGIGSINRVPIRLRPYGRVMLVLAHVSSMKTMRSGSIGGWLCFQQRRASATSLRCCSAGISVFFFESVSAR